MLSQPLTLYTTPVIYLAFDRLAKRVTRRRSRRVQLEPRRRPAYEFFRAVYTPVGGDDALDHSPRAGRHARLFFLAGLALAASGFSDHPGQGRLPGASPETMASSVATPLERQFGRIAGITEMTSSSSLGSTSVMLQFDLNRNIDAAARDVQAAINAARSQLPAEPAQ